MKTLNKIKEEFEYFKCGEETEIGERSSEGISAKSKSYNINKGGKMKRIKIHFTNAGRNGMLDE